MNLLLDTGFFISMIKLLEKGGRGYNSGA